MPGADIEDAVSTAIVDLFDYWLHLDSSVSAADSERNFAFACRRGIWTATAALLSRYNEYEHEFLLQPSLDSDQNENDRVPLKVLEEFADDGLGPEDLYLQAEELNELRTAIESLTIEDWDNWFEDYMTGLTEREAAEGQGVTGQAIHKRRRKGLAMLMEALP